MDKVGKEGVITVEEAKGLETTLDLVEGMRFDRGYLSPYFVTDPERMEGVLDEPFILIHEKKISSMKDLLPVLENIAKSGKPLLIIAEDVEGEALATLVVNKIRGTFKCIAVKAPGFGDPPQGHAGGHRDPHRRPDDRRGARHQARERDPERSRHLQEDHCRQGKHHRGGRRRGGKADIEGRIKQIRAQIEDTTSDYDREKLQERLAKLAGGVAVVQVGAATEIEMKEKKARVEDALHSTRAGRRGRHRRRRRRGADSGCRKALKNLRGQRERVLRRAHRSSARPKSPPGWIASNAGADASVVVDAIKKGKGAYGYNAARGEFEDLIKAGILDPTKVVRSALQNAASVAGLLITTEAMITDKPEKKQPAAPPMPEDY